MTIELLHMDCMDYMAGCEDNAFDLAIVDPPYGISVARRGQIGGVRKALHPRWENESVRQFAPKEWDAAPPPPEYFAQLRRISAAQIIWGGNYFASHLTETNAWIFWDKEANAPGLTFSDGELAWTSFATPLRRVKIPWLGFGGVNIGEIKTHPAQKPVALYRWLLENYAKPGQRILDTHLGSGSSAIAAHYFGVDFVGTEIDADYYAAAVERFNNETKQAQLFEVTPEQAPEQEAFL